MSISGIPRSPLTSTQIQAACQVSILDDATRFSGAKIDATVSTVGKKALSELRFYSVPKEISINTTPTTKALNSVVIPNITGHTIQYGYCEILFGDVRDLSSALNYVDGGQNIQIDNVAAGGWINAVAIPDRACQVLADGVVKEPIISGAIDVTAKMNFNDTISFQWLNADALGASLSMYRIQTVVVLIVETS